MFARVRGRAGVHLSSWKVMQQAACSYTHDCTQACILTQSADTENMLLHSV